MSDEQFSGMACYVDGAEWDRQETAEFGKPVLLRTQRDYFEVYVSGVWYPCGLSDLDMSTGVQEFIDSVKRLVERQRKVQAS